MRPKPPDEPHRSPSTTVTTFHPEPRIIHPRIHPQAQSSRSSSFTHHASYIPYAQPTVIHPLFIHSPGVPVRLHPRAWSSSQMEGRRTLVESSCTAVVGQPEAAESHPNGRQHSSGGEGAAHQGKERSAGPLISSRRQPAFPQIPAGPFLRYLPAGPRASLLCPLEAPLPCRAVPLSIAIIISTTPLLPKLSFATRTPPTSCAAL